MLMYEKTNIINANKILGNIFAEWRAEINQVGWTAFVLFLACLGTDEHRFTAGFLSSVLITWRLIDIQKRFPDIIKKLRNSGNPRTRKIANKIVSKHLLGRNTLLCTPYWLGYASLISLLVYPLISTNYDAMFYTFTNLWPPFN